VFADYLSQEQVWGKLFHEFCSVASRDEEIGLRFRACFRARKEALIRLLENEAVDAVVYVDRIQGHQPRQR